MIEHGCRGQQRQTARVRLAWTGIAALVLLPIVQRQAMWPPMQPETSLAIALLVLAAATRFWDGLVEQIREALSDWTGFAFAIATLSPYVLVVAAIAAIVPTSAGGSVIWGCLAAAACWCQRTLSDHLTNSPSSRFNESSSDRNKVQPVVSDLSQQSAGPAESASTRPTPVTNMDAFEFKLSESIESDPMTDQEFDSAEGLRDCLHRYERGQSAELGDFVEGCLRIELAAGQAHHTAHVTFCPPFDEPPEVSCESLDDPTVRIKVAAVFRHGVRLEIRRSHPESQAVIELGYAAFTGNARQRAA